MSNSDETHWIKETANQLNNALQLISESSKMLETICAELPNSQKYFAILRGGVERGVTIGQMLGERVGGYYDPDNEAAKPPLVPLPVPSPAQPGTDLRIRNPDGKHELILIVDDEEVITELAQEVLADEGYRIVTAQDGFQALEIYRRLKEQIALVILDFTMPVLNGEDVFAEVRLINPNATVVLSSGFAENECMRGMLARGLRGFIPKPYTQQKLLSQVRSVLDTLKAA
jgi:CheY-like chemotaxis protein